MIVRFNEEQYKTIWVLSGLKIHSSPKYFIFGTPSREIDDAIYPRVVIIDWKKHDWLNESYPRKWIQTITVLPILNEDSCITKKLFNNNNKLVNINRGAKKCLIIVSVSNVRGDTWHRSRSRSWHCSSNQFHRWHRLHCQLKHIILINNSD